MIIGSSYIYRDITDSTNNFAHQLIKESRPAEGTIIHTGYQSAGKGQKGNTWESERGKNLLFSIILYPAVIRPEEQFIISMAVSLGICDFIGRHVKRCTIKWPNDIYAGDDKIAGILIENSISGERIDYSVVGIGLNVNQEKFPLDVPNAVSLKMLTGKDYNTEACLKKLAADLDRRYMKILSGKQAAIRNDYTSSMYLFMEWYNFMTDQGPVYGRIISVDTSGRLMIEDEYEKIHRFSFREVSFMH
ncbi:MAG: biotin--[acetyl-CoA-carboxylase] ligase [Bacteroidota bacterium]|nr:biotin--[acetyl-CoA-carboxylase] ligase [Bacteroidota bacterium]